MLILEFHSAAAAYDDHFASVTDQAIGPALDLIDHIVGTELLDICCGTGNLVSAARKRGANVTGVDFAPTMIEIASSKVPQAAFYVGDAEALQFESSNFDAAICSFGLWHLAAPDNALTEAARVLKPDGVYIYTTWLPPTKGWDLFDIVVGAINQHGSMDVDLPLAPPPFRFANETEAIRSLSAQGFKDIVFHEMAATWTGQSGQDALEMIYKSIVRMPILIDAQSPEAQEAIKNQIVENADAMRADGRIRMRWPYALVSARRG